MAWTRPTTYTLPTPETSFCFRFFVPPPPLWCGGTDTRRLYANILTKNIRTTSPAKRMLLTNLDRSAKWKKTKKRFGNWEPTRGSILKVIMITDKKCRANFKFSVSLRSMLHFNRVLRWLKKHRRELWSCDSVFSPLRWLLLSGGRPVNKIQVLNLRSKFYLLI